MISHSRTFSDQDSHSRRRRGGGRWPWRRRRRRRQERRQQLEGHPQVRLPPASTGSDRTKSPAQEEAFLDVWRVKPRADRNRRFFVEECMSLSMLHNLCRLLLPGKSIHAYTNKTSASDAGKLRSSVGGDLSSLARWGCPSCQTPRCCPLLSGSGTFWTLLCVTEYWQRYVWCYRAGFVPYHY